jgi:hypothetical protein
VLIAILNERQIRQLIGPQEALAPVRAAFVKFARGEATPCAIAGL